MHADLISAYRFEVVIEKQLLGFRSVSGLKLTAAFEPLMVGGVNTGPVMLPVPVKDTGKLTMEKGVASANVLKGFQHGQLITDDMQINVFGIRGESKASYSVAFPVLESIELSKLEATDSSVFIETFTVMHQGISRLKA